ncbi:MAG: NADH:ubiquinone oxidoreductase [Alphaproteobacteria bacterium]
MQQVVLMTVFLVVAAGVLGFVLGYLISGMFETDTAGDDAAPAKTVASAKPVVPAKAAPTAPAPKKSAPVAQARPVKPATPAKSAAPAKSATPAKPTPTPLRGPMAVRAEEAKKQKSKPAAKKRASSKPSKPRLLKQARGGKPDNLKRIGGVGPKLEGVLNDLGIFHYDQVAKLTAKQIEWVDDKLSFKGRIAREDWVGQATKLAAGEATEFAGRVDKGKVASSKAKAKKKS